MNATTELKNKCPTEEYECCGGHLSDYIVSIYTRKHGNFLHLAELSRLFILGNKHG